MPAAKDYASNKNGQRGDASNVTGGAPVVKDYFTGADSADGTAYRTDKSNGARKDFNYFRANNLTRDNDS